MVFAAGIVVALALGLVALWLALEARIDARRVSARAYSDLFDLEKRIRTTYGQPGGGRPDATTAQALEHSLREEISGQVTKLRASLTDLIECKNVDLRGTMNRIQDERAKIAREWKDVDERAREAHARASDCLGRVFACENTTNTLGDKIENLAARTASTDRELEQVTKECRERLGKQWARLDGVSTAVRAIEERIPAVVEENRQTGAKLFQLEAAFEKMNARIRKQKDRIDLLVAEVTERHQEIEVDRNGLGGRIAKLEIEKQNRDKLDPQAVASEFAALNSNLLTLRNQVAGEIRERSETDDLLARKSIEIEKRVVAAESNVNTLRAAVEMEEATRIADFDRLSTKIENQTRGALSVLELCNKRHAWIDEQKPKRAPAARVQRRRAR